MTRFHGVLLALLLSSACSGIGKQIDQLDTPVHHVLSFGRRGLPIDPSGNDCEDDSAFYCQGTQSSLRGSRSFIGPYERSEAESPELKTKYDKHIDNILCAIAQSEKKEILIFVHGGLGSRKGSQRRVKVLERLIADEGQPHGDRVFPIFINWRASLKSTYTDSVFFLRQGKRQNRNPIYIAMSPFYFLADIGRGLVRAPLLWIQVIKNSWRNLPDGLYKDSVRRKMNQLNDDGPDSTFWRNDTSCPPSLRGAATKVPLVVTIPSKLALAPILSGVGTSAWIGMQRRTDTLFYNDDYYHRGFLKEPDAKEEESHPEGYLAIFLDRLEQRLEEGSPCGKPLPSDLSITLVGHSMGAIVINQILKLHGDLPIRRVVYMAAASSVRDYEEITIPYLESEESAEVFHLGLNMKADVSETNWKALDLIPRGSLLVWLDDFLDDPRITPDRVAGYFRNLPKVADLDGQEEVAKRIHMKSYGYGRCSAATDPQKHGHFSSRFKLWDPTCWEPENRNCLWGFDAETGRCASPPDGVECPWGWNGETQMCRIESEGTLPCYAETGWKKKWFELEKVSSRSSVTPAPKELR